MLYLKKIMLSCDSLDFVKFTKKVLSVLSFSALLYGIMAKDNTALTSIKMALASYPLTTGCLTAYYLLRLSGGGREVY
jgi:hypothetical protein